MLQKFAKQYTKLAGSAQNRSPQIKEIHDFYERKQEKKRDPTPLSCCHAASPQSEA